MKPTLEKYEAKPHTIDVMHYDGTEESAKAIAKEFLGLGLPGYWSDNVEDRDNSLIVNVVDDLPLRVYKGCSVLRREDGAVFPISADRLAQGYKKI